MYLHHIVAVLQNCFLLKIKAQDLAVQLPQAESSHKPADPLHVKIAGIETVSYTHLDVYKRQIYTNMAIISIAAFMITINSSYVLIITTPFRRWKPPGSRNCLSAIISAMKPFVKYFYEICAVVKLNFSSTLLISQYLSLIHI